MKLSTLILGAIVNKQGGEEVVRNRICKAMGYGIFHESQAIMELKHLYIENQIKTLTHLSNQCYYIDARLGR